MQNASLSHAAMEKRAAQVVRDFPTVCARLKDMRQQVAAIRAYFRQWIESPVWDENPLMTADGQAELDQLRLRSEGLKDRRSIERWVDDATEAGLDPL